MLDEAEAASVNINNQLIGIELDQKSRIDKLNNMLVLVKAIKENVTMPEGLDESIFIKDHKLNKNLMQQTLMTPLTGSKKLIIFIYALFLICLLSIVPPYLSHVASKRLTKMEARACQIQKA